MAELINREKYEVDFAQRLGKLSARHRRELLSLMGTPPDRSRVTEAFWDRVRRETEEEAAAILLLIFIASASQHGSTPQMSEMMADVWVQSHASGLARDYVDNSRDKIVAVEPDMNRQQVIEIVDKVFGPDRVETIAISETTNAVSAGSESAVKETVGLSDKDTWFTVRDDRVCPICEPLHGKPRSYWSRFFPGGPQAHPRCRCWIKYASETQAA